MSDPSNPKFNKSEFIRARPNLTPTEICEEAEKLGEVISQRTVWSIRSTDKRKAEGKAPKKSKGEKKAPKEKKVKTSKKGEVKTEGEKAFNKSAFIRKYPKKTAKVISEAASEIGQEISPTMVHSIRSLDSRKNETQKGKKTKKVSTPRKATPTGSNGSPIPGRASISFDPSDPVARKFIARALRANA